MNAEILAVGHELLMGEIVDTNSSYIAQQLSGTGITVRWMSHIGDNIDHLSDAFKRGLERSDVVISTGGLGPTSDDLTREAVSNAVGEEMKVDPEQFKPGNIAYFVVKMESAVKHLSTSESKQLIGVLGRFDNIKIA